MILDDETREEANALIRDTLRRFDPTVFMEDAGLSPDPWQVRALRSTAKKMILLASRQSGKSTVAAMISLHMAIYNPGSLSIISSPTERQSIELFRKIRTFYNAIGAPDLSRELTTTLELTTGSRIVALPGDPETIRGFSAASLAILDEAARVPDSLYLAVSPMLAVSGGRLLLLSTPKGRRGIFHEIWISQDPDWERIRARASECPRISPKFLAEQRLLLGQKGYDQEYESEFIEVEDQVFSSDSIDLAFDSDEAPLIGW